MQDHAPPLNPLLPASGPEMSLYQQLLECLEEERQALITSREEAILTLAARKEAILEELVRWSAAHGAPGPDSAEASRLLGLKRQAAAAQQRNHRLIIAALEVIQEFFLRVNLAAPHCYQAEGRLENAGGGSFFHRQA